MLWIGTKTGKGVKIEKILSAVAPWKYGGFQHKAWDKVSRRSNTVHSTTLMQISSTLNMKYEVCLVENWCHFKRSIVPPVSVECSICTHRLFWWHVARPTKRNKFHYLLKLYSCFFIQHFLGSAKAWRGNSKNTVIPTDQSRPEFHYKMTPILPKYCTGKGNAWLY